MASEGDRRLEPAVTRRLGRRGGTEAGRLLREKGDIKTRSGGISHMVKGNFI